MLLRARGNGLRRVPVDGEVEVFETEHPLAIVKRLAHFLRLVIPSDPWQLVFLAGMVCLTVAPGLRWTEVANSQQLSAIARVYQQSLTTWYAFAYAASLLIIIGAAAGYAACFWPGKRPVRRILLTVCIPALLGLAAHVARNILLERSTKSVLERTNWAAVNIRGSFAYAWELGPGVHFCVIGAGLAALFALRIHLRLSRLPLALPLAPGSSGENVGLPGRPKILLWFVVGPQSWILGLPFLPPLLLMTSTPSFLHWGKLYLALMTALMSVFELGVALWVMGEEGRMAVKRYLGRPQIRWVALGTLMPTVLVVLPSTIYFLYERSQWTAHSFGKVAPPEFWDHLPIPHLLPVLTFFFAAAFEEVVFRGMVQSLFLRSYGLFWRTISTGMRVLAHQ